MASMKTRIFSFIAVLICVSTNNEVKLQMDKLRDYNINIIPTITDEEPLLVNVVMFPHSIIRFLEQDELLNINMYVHLNWRDNRLGWEPLEYGNKTRTIYKQKQMWLPDLVLTYSKEDMKQIGFDNLNIGVDFTGKVIWEPGVVAEITCSIDPSYFPFDEQSCQVVFSTWAHDPKSVKFIVKSDGDLDMSFYKSNGLWEITKSWSEIEEYEFFSLVRFVIILKRRSTYYITSLICPVITVSVLNCMAFLPPIDCGERLSYAMTSFLSFMVLLSITTENLPKTSKQTPYFVLYLTSMLILALFTVIFSVAALMLRQKCLKEDDDTENLNSEERLEGTYEQKYSKQKKVKATQSAKICDRQIQSSTAQTPMCCQDALPKLPEIRCENATMGHYSVSRWKNTKVGKYLFGCGCDSIMFIVVSSITCLITIVTFLVLSTNNH